MTEDEARQRVIRAMCPTRVCRTCGEPSRRVVERETFWVGTGAKSPGGGRGEGMLGMPTTGHNNAVGSRIVAEAWTDCGHNDWRPGVWLDPFAER